MDPEEKGKDLWELITRYSDLYNQIGHYLNIIMSNYTITGVSYLQRNDYDAFYKSGGFAQNFTSDKNFLDSAIDSSKTYDASGVRRPQLSPQSCPLGLSPLWPKRPAWAGLP